MLLSLPGASPLPLPTAPGQPLCPSLFPQGMLCSLPRVLQLTLLSKPWPVLLPADPWTGAAPRDWGHLDW